MNGRRPGGWVALAWRYFRDPKFADVSPWAELLWVHALCYCGENETDGRIPRQLLVNLARTDTASRVAPTTKRPLTLAKELVRAGLWVETDQGFAFPSDTWSRWQTTAEQAAASRARTAARKAEWRAARRGTTTSHTKGVPRLQGQGQGQGPTYVGPTAPQSVVESDLFTDDDGRLYVRRDGQ